MFARTLAANDGEKVYGQGSDANKLLTVNLSPVAATAIAEVAAPPGGAGNRVRCSGPPWFHAVLTTCRQAAGSLARRRRPACRAPLAGGSMRVNALIEPLITALSRINYARIDRISWFCVPGAFFMKFHLQLSAGIALGQLCVTGHATSAELPWQDAGLSELEAAAFVLDRLTYGARPGDVDQVLEIGIEQWLAEQLAGDDPEADLEVRLADYEALGMSHGQIGRRYPGGLQMSAHLRRFHPGVIPDRGELVLDFSVVREKVNEFREANGYLFQEHELRAQLVNQKVDRAVYAENQLREVLTDFWQNHFFTSPASFRARMWVLSFEAEAIRPNALGDFRTLLGTVSKHPAMRSYHTGNEQPSELAPGDSTFDMIIAERAAETGAATIAEALRARAESEVVALEYDDDLVLSREFWTKTGPNLSYADALTRLQTLGP
ncbi:MAG: DUF1800 family protein, partial [Chloroflexi bacterium]|nr:DUF1800 family protein [Chloroflexota bacterium]